MLRSIVAILAFATMLACTLADAHPEQGQNPVATSDKLEVPARVDERVELMSIIFRLAGANEYSQAPADAPYVKEVDAYFTPFRKHEAVKLASKLWDEDGIGFDKVASFSIHIKGGPKLVPKIAFEESPSGLIGPFWTKANAKQFLASLQHFVDDTKAFDFFEKHRDLYARSAKRLADEVAKRPYRAWLDSFFGVKLEGAEFCALIGMLNGAANYGPKVTYSDGKEELLPIIGASSFDKEGIPVFGDRHSALVAHEFCHSYCNPLVEKHAEKLVPLGDKIFPRRENLLRPQAYASGRVMLYESLVRACTHRFLVRHGTAREAALQLNDEVGRGFFWTPELSKLLAEYEGSREKYKTTADFMPRVILFFENLANNLDSKMDKLPRIVSITPAIGAKDVDPKTIEFVIVFDRPMNKVGRALVGNPKDMPNFQKGDYSADGKTYRQLMKLEPSRNYHFNLNSAFHHGFVSAEGLPLDPVSVTFSTAK